MFTTNLVHQKEALLTRDYYFSVNMERYIAAIIDTINNGGALMELVKPATRIKETIATYRG